MSEGEGELECEGKLVSVRVSECEGERVIERVYVCLCVCVCALRSR